MLTVRVVGAMVSALGRSPWSLSSSFGGQNDLGLPTDALTARVNDPHWQGEVSHACAERSGFNRTASVISRRYSPSDTRLSPASALQGDSRMTTNNPATFHRSDFAVRRRTGRPNWALIAVVSASLVASVAVPATASADDHDAVTSHAVADGDTLWDISREYNVSLASLLARNGLEVSAVLQVGDVIKLPEEPGDGPAVIHEVAAGESISEIAELYGVKERSLLAANEILDAGLIRVGDELRIPWRPRDQAATRTIDVSHTVGAGEVLSVIAEKYDVPVAAILAANDLANPDFIRRGDVLKVPGVVPRNSTEELTVLFEYWADEFDIDRDLLKGIGYQESTWRPDAESEVGAMGIAQIMPTTSTWIQEALLDTSGLDPWNPDDNLHMSAAFLAHLIEQTDGNVAMAVGSYYQGLGSVRKNGFYKETERYIDGVFGYAEDFADGVLPG